MKTVEQEMEQDAKLRTVRFAGCFGWLHTPADGVSNGTAVVICPGLSTDGLTGYRPLRLLATAFADAGFPTLRFDYPGIGNSDDAHGKEFWQACQVGIHAAVDWLLHHDLADRVVLCGLRAGATLAMEVSATRDDVTGLLMLEPVLRGRSYLRQLSLEAAGGVTDTAAAGPLAVHELMLSANTVQYIKQIDLRLSRPAPSCRIGVFTQAPAKLLSECVAAWRDAGITVDSRDFAGLDALLRPVLMSHLASVDATPAVAWLRGLQPRPSRVFALERLPAGSELVEAAFTETPMRFGSGRNLFGILCEPARHPAVCTAVVITNSSGNPASGFGRFGVELARRLAATGIASLRMDFAGLGDSIAPDDGATHIFEADRTAELRSAVDLLVTRGYRQIALQGLCSGAYHALYGGFDDPRVGALVLINLQHLVWDGEDRVELKGYALRHPSHFLKKLGSRTVWVNLIRGKFDVAGIVAVQLTRLSDELHRLRLGLGRRLGREIEAPATMTDRMQILSLRAKTLFLMSAGDDGIAVLAREFGPALRIPGAIVEILQDADHALSSAAMRQVAIGRITTFLQNYVRSEQTAVQPLLAASAA